MGNFVDLYGAAAADPRASFDVNWTREAWTRGCPVGHAGRGALTRYGQALRKRTGRIHWAGTETADYWNGYMDGAVRSSRRATDKALDALGRRHGRHQPESPARTSPDS